MLPLLVEKYNELAEKAWALIEEIEGMGGMTKAVVSGMPKLRVEESAARRQAMIDRGEEVIVGVNKYRLAKEDPIDILDIDNVKVREAQIGRLNSMRATRDEAVEELPGRDLRAKIHDLAVGEERDEHGIPRLKQ